MCSTSTTRIASAVLSALAAGALPDCATAQCAGGVCMSRVLPSDSHFGTHAVRMTTGDMTVFFDSQYGGTPRWWALDPNPQSIIEPYPGAGMSVVYDTGQDSTQATANGNTPHPIARIGDPGSIALYNYYIRETVYQPPSASDPRAVYEIAGAAPFFWLSYNAADDAIIGGKGSGWYFPGYDACSNTALNTLPDPGCAAPLDEFNIPIYFLGRANDPTRDDGVLLIANQLTPLDLIPPCTGTPRHWTQRLCEIPDGRVAFKVRVSLAAASADSFASIWFRRQMPTSESAGLSQAFESAGYSFNVNRLGHLALMKVHPGGGQQTLWSTAEQPALIPFVQERVNSAAGVLLEVRTHNGDPSVIDLFVENQHVSPPAGDPASPTIDAVDDPTPYLYPHTALYAYSPGNCTYVKFSERQVFDMGLEFRAKYTARPDGYIESEVSVVNAPLVPQNLQRGFKPSSGLVYPFFQQPGVAGYNVTSAWAVTQFGAADYSNGVVVPCGSPCVCGQPCAPPCAPNPAIDVNSARTNAIRGGPDSTFAAWFGDPSGATGLYCVVYDAQINLAPAINPYLFQTTQHPDGYRQIIGGPTPLPFVYDAGCNWFPAAHQRIRALWGRSYLNLATIYLDATAPLTQNGSSAWPLASVREAVSLASGGNALSIRAGYYDEIDPGDAALALNKPLTVCATGGLVRIGP